ncbi:hypothetical protein [Streptosporangium sp. NPDC051022]|uniref:hypothetical protein n=1 Tax=Streptosporangium sp. NPDC051022 TaxID=3155752 RepID=UPI0034301827
MKVSRRVLAACTMALITGGALIASPSASAAPRRDTVSAHTARAAVTDLREVVNQLPDQVDFLKQEDGSGLRVPPNGQWVNSIWIPWVGGDNEMGKSIIVYRNLRARYWIFQDYWNPTDLIRYSTTNSYHQSLPVPGSSTGGGRKRLTIRPDGSLFMENTN